MPGNRRSSRERGIPRSQSCVTCRNFYRTAGRETCSLCHKPPRTLQRKLAKYKGPRLQALVKRASVDRKAKTIMARIVRNFCRGVSFRNRRQRTLGMASELVEIIKGQGKVGVTAQDAGELSKIAKDARASLLPYAILLVLGAITVDRWNLSDHMNDTIIDCYYVNSNRDPHEYNCEELLAEPFVPRDPLERLRSVDLGGPLTLAND